MNGNAQTIEFESRVEELKKVRGDHVSIAEVAEVVESIMATIEGDVTGLDLRVYKELDSIANYIQAAKSEIVELCPDDIREQHLPAASDELDAIVQATEEATGNILDAAEKIDNEGNRLGLKEVSDQVIRIFEACSFQDITGQRISKVVGTLKHIEERVDRLVKAFGAQMQGKKMRPEQCDSPEEDWEKSLLSGPQLPTEANKQAEIDALLASFD